MKELKNISQINEGKIILLFSSNSCSDCLVLDTYIDEIIDEHKEYEFLKVDNVKFLELAKEYDIFGIPSFVAFDNGEKLGDFISTFSKTKEEINNWIATL